MKKKLAEGGRRRPASTPKVSVNAYYRQSRDGTTASPFESRLPKRVWKKLFVRGLDVIFVFVLAIGIIASLLINPRPNLHINDLTYHKKSEYVEYIQNRLGQFKSRNKITFDELALENSLSKAFPEVVSTTIELPIFSQKPVVTLTVAKPAFFIRAHGDEYLLSGNGVAVDLKSYYPHLAGLPTIDDESGFTLTKGKHVLSQQDINFLQSLVGEVRYQNIPLKKIVLPNSPEEADLYTTDSAYYTKFFMGGDAAIQVGQYLSARNSFKSDPPPSQYLDVRVSGKVFYK